MYGKVNVLYPRYDKLKSETISHFGGQGHTFTI